MNNTSFTLLWNRCMPCTALRCEPTTAGSVLTILVVYQCETNIIKPTSNQTWVAYVQCIHPQVRTCNELRYTTYRDMTYDRHVGESHPSESQSVCYHSNTKSKELNCVVGVTCISGAMDSRAFWITLHPYIWLANGSTWPVSLCASVCLCSGNPNSKNFCMT